MHAACAVWRKQRPPVVPVSPREAKRAGRLVPWHLSWLGHSSLTCIQCILIACPVSPSPNSKSVPVPAGPLPESVPRCQCARKALSSLSQCVCQLLFPARARQRGSGGWGVQVKQQEGALAPELKRQRTLSSSFSQQNHVYSSLFNIRGRLLAGTQHYPKLPC